MNDHENDDHDRGLAHDLDIIRQQLDRRRAVGFLAGSAVALAGSFALARPSLPGVARSSSSGGRSSASSSSSTRSTASTSSSSSTTSSSSATGSCLADPQATSGPYPADGSNTSSGSTSDILTSSGIVRSDIRSSFLTTTTTAAGLVVKFTITLVNSNNSCAPLAGYAIYFWQCDAAGHYSLYTAAAESYLRGVQVTDANGQVTFTTIFPACYDGRWPHMHFEVYKSLSAATSYKNAALTSQFAMPQAVASAVYSANASTYSSSTANLAKVALSTDLVFAAFTSAQLAQATPAFSGNTSSGYTATAVVGLSV